MHAWFDEPGFSTEKLHALASRRHIFATHRSAVVGKAPQQSRRRHRPASVTLR
jgi:hypothetical protein